MGIDNRLKNLRGSGRREFLRWGGTVAACLGLERAKLLNFVNDTGGSALADNLSCSTTNRSVHLIGGNGGFAWFTLLWPHNQIATGSAANAAYAFTQPGKQVQATLTDNTFYYAPESPFQKLGKKFQMSAFMAGKPETHTTTPTTAAGE